MAGAAAGGARPATPVSLPLPERETAAARRALGAGPRAAAPVPELVGRRRLELLAAESAAEDGRPPGEVGP